MKINPNIFKSYDIRGIYPKELDEKTAYIIGKAFIEHTKAKKVVIGRDARLAGEELLNSIIKGMNEMGADVSNIGQVPTECVYFSVSNYNFDAGVMITASHNPKEYNGFKMLKKDGKNINIIRGKDLLSIVTEKEIIGDKKGEIKEKDIWQDFSSYILAFADLSKIMPLKIVIDASNGVAGKAIEKIQDNLPVEIIPLNFEPNGNFPDHSPNPLEKGSSDKISEIIKKEKADFGLIFDGDADRVFLLDENGEMIRADITLLLLAKHFLEKNPGMAIAYNAICSKAVPTFVKKWGGVPIRTQVGFVNVRAGLLENNGIMGGELSGHYCFKDYFYFDSGMIAFLTLLLVFSKEAKKVSEIVKEFSLYAKGAEINFTVKDKEAVLEKIKQKYSDGKQDYLDGITVEYKDWWFNVRGSNTEPLLRLTLEADTEEILKAKQKELTTFIK